MTDKENIRRRGRPRGFDTDDAVDRATHLFHSRGYDAVGVAELGAELGIKAPSLYAAFGSKAGLFSRALEHYGAGKANLFVAAQREGGDVAAVIERMLRLAAAAYPERDGVAGCLVADGSRGCSDPRARAMVVAAKAESREGLRAFIAGEYPERAAELADFVGIALAGMSSSARDGADAETLGAFAETASRAFRAAAAR